MSISPYTPLEIKRINVPLLVQHMTTKCKALGISEMEAMRGLGLADAYLSNLRNSGRVPGAVSLLKIAAWLEANPYDYVGEYMSVAKGYEVLTNAWR